MSDAPTTEVEEYEIHPLDAYRAHRERVQAIFDLSAEEFATQTAKDRDVALFLMLQEISGNVNYLRTVVENAEAKIDEFKAGGFEKVISDVMSSGVMGKVMGGMF